MSPRILGAALSLLALPALAATGGECGARSGPQRAALLELYTSEGCSSCPPADRWLARLPLDGAGPRLVPLAFHVDYWDGIGWKDRFSDPAWSTRQRQAVSRGGGRVVYTPQVMRNGRDFPGWRDGASLAKAAAAEPAARASLALRLAATPGVLSVSAEVPPLGGPLGAARLFLALTESGLVTAVRAGENRGETLGHEHVVRSLVALGSVDPPARAFTHVFALRGNWKPADLAVVAFVQDERSGEVLQALRLPNCPG